MKRINLAVILAAGVGIRIRPLVEKKPKGFISFGGEAIIKNSIGKLNYSGISKIVIVTGYQDHFYEELSEEFSQIKTIKNQHYSESGSMYSLYTARHMINEDFILLESDILYETRALTELINNRNKDVILVSGPTKSSDEVYVASENGKVVNISKDKEKIRNLAGELVGISKISLSLYRKMLKNSLIQFEKTFKCGL